MTPVRQTIFVDTNPKKRGNCQSAAMASILDLPLDQVIDTASDECRDGGFWKTIGEWLASRGLKLVHMGPNDPRLIGSYSIGSGPSPRGAFHHAVVCKHGHMVWDPHPSDDGVLRIEAHDVIAPMTDIEIRMHQLRSASC